MSRLLLAMFAILAIFAVSTATSGCVESCPKNEVWESCGTACPPTCENPDPKICTLQCVAGCQCVHGLVRDKWNKCIPREECPCE